MQRRASAVRIAPLLIAICVVACGGDDGDRTPSTPGQPSAPTATVTAPPATPLPPAEAPARPEGGDGIADPFAFCAAARDAAEPYFLYAPEGGTQGERYRASVRYAGPLYVGETYPFRAGAFARDWMCAGGRVLTCPGFGTVDCTTDRNAWSATRPGETFRPPIPPLKPFEPLPEARRSGAPIRFTHAGAYCAAIGNTDVLSSSTDPATNPFPDQGPQWAGTELPRFETFPALWRCEAGQVLVCPLTSAVDAACHRRNADEAPSAETERLCAEVRNTWQLPAALNWNARMMYVRGCSNGRPVITGIAHDTADVDRFGWLLSAWRAT
jgi:hypothetical protein